MKSNPWQIHSDDTPYISPDGEKEFFYYGISEIRMGSPLSGPAGIKINGKTFELSGSYSCPPIWSDNSRYAAVPYWNPELSQKLVIIDVELMEISLSVKNYRVLDLKKFTGTTLKGVDSPIHNADRFTIDILDMPVEQKIKIG